MKITAIHIGMSVMHPKYGVGLVKGISEFTVDVVFDDGKRIIDPEAAGLQPVGAQANLSGLEMPLNLFVEQIVEKTLAGLGLEREDKPLEGLGAKWHGGNLILRPADASLQAKEVPLEVFFHKVVMMRNNLRVLEQKLNSSDKLTDGEKVELQQYITRCYGSMTTFNALFKEKEDYFSTKGE